MGWEVRPLGAALGAEILGADLSRVGKREFAAINGALLEHQVIFFREQTFTPAHHRVLAGFFGPAQTHPAYSTVDGFPEITILENDRENPSLIERYSPRYEVLE